MRRFSRDRKVRGERLDVANRHFRVGLRFWLLFAQGAATSRGALCPRTPGRGDVVSLGVPRRRRGVGDPERARERAPSAHRAAARIAPAYVTAGPGPADPDWSLGVLPADRDLREDVRLLKMRLEHVDCRLRIEREERRLNETRLIAALRESRRALERVRAAVERDTDA